MSKYGKTAVRAVDLVRSGVAKSAADAWQIAAAEIFEGKEESQKKSCPKGAFLGLCEEGLVVGVPPGSYTNSTLNKYYAIDAVNRLRREPALETNKPLEFWHRLINGEDKQHNGQMNVVLMLWANKLISNR